MKVALVHDFLTQDGGAERVLSVLASMYPTAPIYTLVYNKEVLGSRFEGKDIRTSFIQRMPGGVRHYQFYLLLMPTAIETFDLSGYDVVISSASAFAKGILTDERTVHICYCHTPTRYLWSDAVSYIKTLPYPKVIRALIPFVLTKLRPWDMLAAGRVDVMVANSVAVAERIRKYYKRESEVIYPPVDAPGFTSERNEKDFFLTGGRLVGYKRFDIVIEACSRLRLPLHIFGTGPDRVRLEKLAGNTVKFLGHVSKKELVNEYASCRAFVHPQVEDFGITAIEAMAVGVPVIAFAGGGALETVRPGISGVFFDEQSWESLADALARFSSSQFSTSVISAEANQYATDVFIQKFGSLVRREIAKRVKR
ncbi:MAG: glycosyltransferase [Patescibacteria group bacterium]|jgi:glycosyltransferase involved in cell wall biosynthesis